MAAIAAASIGSILGFGLPLLKKAAGSYILKDVETISWQMGFIRATFEDYARSSADHDKVTEEWLKHVKNLAYDIEDFTDKFLSRYMPRESSYLLSGAWRHVAIRFHIGRKIRKFRKQSAAAHGYFKAYKVKHTSAPTTTQKASDEVHPHMSMEDSLLQLVTNTPRGSETEPKPKVISIIGYSALGNSLLVDKVYNNNTAVHNQFTRHARVDAAAMDVEEVLVEILRQVSKNQNGVIGTSNIVDVKGKGVMKHEATDGTSRTIVVKTSIVIKHEEIGSTSSTIDVKGNGVMESEEARGTFNTVDVKDKGVMEHEVADGTSSTVDAKGNGVMNPEDIDGTSSTTDVKVNDVMEPEETSSTSNAINLKGNGIMEPEETRGTSSEIDGKGKGNGVMVSEETRGTCCEIDGKGNDVMEPEESRGTTSANSVKGNDIIQPEQTDSTSSAIDVKGNGFMKPKDTRGTSSEIDVKDKDIKQSNETGSTSGTIDVKGNDESNETGGIFNDVSLSKRIESCLKGVRFLLVIDNVNMENLNCIIIHLRNVVDAVVIATTDYTEAIHCKCPSFGLDCSTTPQYLMMQELEEKGYEQDQTEKRKKALQDLLVSKYNKCLSNLNLEQCLLYFCMFPYGHLVRWNLLKMRYMAEGIAFDKQKHFSPDGYCSPLKCLDDFVDQHEVQPVQVRKNGQVKRCQLPVMLLNHIFSESKSARFLTLFCGSTDINCLDADEKESVRRLSLHHAQNGTLRLPNSSDLPRLRTLVVFHPESTVSNIYELPKYKLLRVLDMKECDFIRTENDLKKICDLLLLRCLSLGDSIDRVPRDIAKLQLLQTLDMTKTKTVYVPVEVMELPELQHLIGKFQLYKDDITKKKLQQLSSTTSKLERLSGFVIDNSKEFGQLMSRMKKLRKVKIWYDAENWTADVSDAIKNFIYKDHSLAIDTEKKGSLSIECKKCPTVFVESLKDDSTVTSLKLCGDLSKFLDFQGRKLTGILELCLSGTNLRDGEIVRVVNLFKSLTYLKLVEHNLGPLKIPADCLYSLTRLCLVATGTLSKITIQDGAPRCLVSLHMLFRKQEYLGGIHITSLPNLKEIALHSRVDQKIKKDWQDRASEHDKKPKVVLLQSPEIEKKATDEQSPAAQSVIE